MSSVSVLMCTTFHRKMVREREALVACSDKSMKIGVTIWDIDTGDNLLHIPTCASPPFGLLCLRNRFLVASQINKHGSVCGGSIGVWSLNKVTFLSSETPNMVFFFNFILFLEWYPSCMFLLLIGSPKCHFYHVLQIGSCKCFLYFIWCFENYASTMH